VVLGGLHGNEPAGVHALERVMNVLAEEPRPVAQGEMVALVGNLSALREGRRYIQRDLNRGWAELSRRERRERLAEEAEAERLDRELRAARDRARGPLFLLDLHTTSGLSHPFLNVADSLASRRFASALRAPVVLGLDEALTGTLMQHAEALGFTCIVFESGQHDDPAAIDFAEAAIWKAMAHLEMIDRRVFRAQLERARRLLGQLPMSQRTFEVTYRHALELETGFKMLPGYASFQNLRSGEVIAEHGGAQIRAEDEAFLLMPLYQPQGTDGFFLMREVGPTRRVLSTALRRLRLETLLLLLPGVERAPDSPQTLRIAERYRHGRIRELLRLLGYRFESQTDEGGRTVGRRRQR
jgi:succinylglutamate desuccinylase